MDNDDGRFVCLAANCFMIAMGLIGVIGSAFQAPDYTVGWAFLTLVFILFTYVWDGMIKDM